MSNDPPLINPVVVIVDAPVSIVPNPEVIDLISAQTKGQRALGLAAISPLATAFGFLEENLEGLVDFLLECAKDELSVAEIMLKIK